MKQDMIPIVLKITAIPVGNRNLGSLGSTHPQFFIPIIFLQMASALGHHSNQLHRKLPSILAGPPGLCEVPSGGHIPWDSAALILWKFPIPP